MANEFVSPLFLKRFTGVRTSEVDQGMNVLAVKCLHFASHFPSLSHWHLLQSMLHCYIRILWQKVYLLALFCVHVFLRNV